MAGPNDPNDPNSLFQLQRKRAAQQEASTLQNNKAALQRRAAQLGGGPGGALLKVEQQQENASADRLTNVNEGIDAAQAAEQRRIREIQEGRAYQTSERVASQEFGAGQADLQRKFQTGERLGSQDFAALQANLGREFTTSERMAIQKYQTGERQSGQEFAKWMENKQFKHQTSLQNDNQKFISKQNELNRVLQSTQFGQQLAFSMSQFEHEKLVDDFNMKMAEAIFNDKDLLEQLLGGGGDGGGFSTGNPIIDTAVDTGLNTATGGAYKRFGGK